MKKHQQILTPPIKPFAEPNTNPYESISPCHTGQRPKSHESILQRRTWFY